MDHYEHTQRGPIGWFLLALAAIVASFAIPGVAGSPEEPIATAALTTVATVFVALALCFHTLTIRETNTRLELVFGPISLFRKRVPFDRILTARPARSRFIDGWGIHWVPGRGWTWNLWGFGCVELELSDGGVLRVGTDEPDRLAAVIRERLSDHPPRVPAPRA